MHSSQRKSRHPFTLLEVLLVLFLIGLGVGVITHQIPKLLESETFERSVDQIKGKITLAQEVMLNCQTDVYLSLIAEEGKLYCRLDTNKPLPKKFKHFLDHHSIIKGIEAISFNRSKEIALFFDGTIGALPEGKLWIKGKRREVILTLKGYPSQIQRGDHALEKSETSYPETIFSLI